MRALLDQLDSGLVFVLTVLLLAAASELGFRMARDADDDRKSQVETLLGAMLGMLALLLGFILSIVEDHHAERSHLVVKEADAIDQAYLRAEMLPEAYLEKVQSLLREYVDVRLSLRTRAELPAVLQTSEKLQRALWAQAVVATAEQPNSRPVSMFVASLNELITASDERIAAAVWRRLPEKLLLALYILAVLSYFVQGHNGGLRHSRVQLVAVLVGISVAMMLTIIVELDRPWQGGIPVNQEPLLRLRQAISVGH